MHVNDAFVDWGTCQIEEQTEKENVPASNIILVDCGLVRDVAWTLNTRFAWGGVYLS
jgi:hypothetical protein